jgi:biopolymer transport protein ExbB
LSYDGQDRLSTLREEVDFMWMTAAKIVFRVVDVYRSRRRVQLGLAMSLLVLSIGAEIAFTAELGNHAKVTAVSEHRFESIGSTVEQDTAVGPSTTEELASASPKSDELSNAGEANATTQQRSMLEMMFTGNPFGIAIVVLILLLSVLSCILIVENAISIRRTRLLPPDVMQALESALALRDTRAAMMICNDIDNHSMATQVVLAGLERFRSSEFGFAEYRSAVEEAGEHITGRLYRKVEILNVIAAIAPMLGLMGTVLGMIDAFNTIAAKQGVAGPEDLAGGIGQALITTLLGLAVAIPTMVAFSYFRTRIDALVSEAGTRIERLMLPLGRRKSSS